MLVRSNWICLLDALMCRIWMLWKVLNKCLNMQKQHRYTSQNKLRCNANRNSGREITVTPGESQIQWVKSKCVPKSGDLSLKGCYFLNEHYLLSLINEILIPLVDFSSSEHFSNLLHSYIVSLILERPCCLWVGLILAAGGMQTFTVDSILHLFIGYEL